LSLEPEAASIWCQQVNVGKQPAFCKTGNKYMVVDLGGAFLLVTLHTFVYVTFDVWFGWLPSKYVNDLDEGLKIKKTASTIK